MKVGEGISIGLEQTGASDFERHGEGVVQDNLCFQGAIELLLNQARCQYIQCRQYNKQRNCYVENVDETGDFEQAYQAIVIRVLSELEL